MENWQQTENPVNSHRKICFSRKQTFVENYEKVKKSVKRVITNQKILTYFDFEKRGN